MANGVTARRYLRFGQRLRAGDLPSVPDRFRGGPDGPRGRVASAWLLSETGALWLSIRRGVVPWRPQLVTLPLMPTLQASPTPGAVALRPGMRVKCHEGFIGRMEGLTFDAESGLALGLVVRIRGDMEALLSGHFHPDRELLAMAGRLAQLSPQWSMPHHQTPDDDRDTLHLNATIEQVASAELIRTDGELAADIADILGRNPAAEPLLPQLTIDVHDGSVTLRGRVPTLRHRASIEQDVWHVSGVYAVRNELRAS